MRTYNLKVGSRLETSIGSDVEGRWHWMIQVDDEPPEFGGPYSTEANADRAAELRVEQIHGPQCLVEDGGTWDSAWDTRQ